MGQHLAIHASLEPGHVSVAGYWRTVEEKLTPTACPLGSRYHAKTFKWTFHILFTRTLGGRHYCYSCVKGEDTGAQRVK